MEKRGAVLADMDGCMCNSQPSMRQRVLEQLGHTLAMEDWIGWNTLFQYALVHTGQSKIQVAQWLFADDVMYAPPCPGSQKLVNDVVRFGMEFGILTSRWDLKQAMTVRWFAKYFPLIRADHIFLRPREIEEVVFKGRMLEQLKPDIFVEDKAELIDDLFAISTPKFAGMEIALLDRPWNRWYDDTRHKFVHRFGNYPESYGLLDLRNWILERW